MGVDELGDDIEEVIAIRLEGELPSRSLTTLFALERDLLLILLLIKLNAQTEIEIEKISSGK